MARLAREKTTRVSISKDNPGDMIPHMLHGTGIFTYIWLRFIVSVGRYTIHGESGDVLYCKPPINFAKDVKDDG